MSASTGNILERLTNDEIESISAAEQIAAWGKVEPKSYAKNLHVLGGAPKGWSVGSLFLFVTESDSLVGMRIAIFDFSDSPDQPRACINLSSRLIMAILKFGYTLVPESDRLDWNAIIKRIFVNTPGLILDIEIFENGDQIQIFSD